MDKCVEIFNYQTRRNMLPILFILFSIFANSGCGYFYSEPELSLPENPEKKIDQVVNTLYENGQFPGAVLVAVKGEVIYKKAIDYANLDDSILNTCDTKFRIASFTKPFTAMLILQLVEEGKLELDGKLIDYLPEFPKEKGKDITIHQLLTHTACITGEWRISNLIDIEKEYYTRERLLECIAKRELVYNPGKGKEYSNFGYALLGLVIEKISGKSYNEILQENICKLAGMKNTIEDITSQPIERRAIGYTCDYFTGFEEASFLHMSFCLGAGQLLSTVEDLYLFDQTLYTNKLLSDESKELFFDNYGWFSMRYPYGKNSRRINSFSLDGSINGFQSHTHRIEKDSVFIVTLRNVKEAVYENQIAIKWASSIVSPVLAILYGEEYDLPKKSAAFEVFKTLINSGALEAEKLKTTIIDKQKDKYYLDDDEFEFFTKELMDNGMESKAEAYEEIYKKPRKKLTLQALIKVYRFTIGKYFYLTILGIQLF